MRLITRILTVMSLAALAALPVQAQPVQYAEGTHYEVLSNPVRTVDADKIEVTEVFWYGCQHCYSFEPLITDWEANLPEDVAFVRSPGMWNELMEIHARIFYAAEALDVFEEVHAKAFSEIHQRGNYLQDEAQIKQLFTSVGVNEDDFESAWESFSVSSSVSRAGSRMRDYGVRGVPSLIVNGKYRVSAGGANPSQNDMLKVAEFLIEEERNAR